MRSHSSLYLVLLCLIVGEMTWAQEPIVNINLLAEDQFAIRSMKIFDTAGKKISRVRTLDSFGLAHANPDKVEAAYRRGDLFEKRRELMATWAAYATESSAEVVSLRAG